MDLLGELLATRRFTDATAARQLGVAPATMRAWIANDAPMPVERQLLLARLLIERVPEMARAGRRLRSHVEAMVLYRAQETKTHLTAPVSRFRAAARLTGKGPPR